MNALINCDRIHNEYEIRPRKEKTYFGDILAVAIVAFFAVFALVISGWSALLYLTGRVENGGPLAQVSTLVGSLVKSTGIV